MPNPRFQTMIPAGTVYRFLLLLLLLLLLLGRLSPAKAVSFNYPGFPPNTPNITFEGDASSSAGGILELTRNQGQEKMTYRSGRALYSSPIYLWDNKTRNLTNFTTRFSFLVRSLEKQTAADGLVFFLAPNGSAPPENSHGGYFSLFNTSDFYSSSRPFGASFRTVAVEFDTFANDGWDPKYFHVGIDVGSVRSAVVEEWPSEDRWINASVDATITYDAVARNLSVLLSSIDRSVRARVALSLVLDLREELPEWVSVGFSATTGFYAELHKIVSWSFYSSLEHMSDLDRHGNQNHSMTGAGAGAPAMVKKQAGSTPAPRLVGVLAGVGVLAAVTGIAWFFLWQKKVGRWRVDGAEEEAGGSVVQLAAAATAGIDEGEFDEGRGPKSFTYMELARATKDFSPEKKLGRGGFGDVYKGVLNNPTTEVAVKKVSKDSVQGTKEYISEVKIISRLRHRNLVQLVGWCHERGDLLLVYEYMVNGSLDAHLFGGVGRRIVPPLSWPVRYKIARGVAAALLYLHEEWQQCVVHRDVKSSNVMLDAGFNAKLGDFGLARLVDHDRGLQTTVLAGTMGYMAPEYAATGKASKESDVYSFGVVALEIACGRRPIEPAAEEKRTRLVEWVWGLYGKRAVLEAADPRLMSSAAVDGSEMERLMVVGLWCAHPDFRQRPNMRYVAAALDFEKEPPTLPEEMPVPTYGTLQAAMAVSRTWQSSSTAVTGTASAGHATGSSAASGGASGSSASAASPLLPPR